MPARAAATAALADQPAPIIIVLQLDEEVALVDLLVVGYIHRAHNAATLVLSGVRSRERKHHP